MILVEFARWERCKLSVYELSSKNWIHEELSTDRDDMFRGEDREFLEAAAGDKPVSCTVAEGRKSLEIVVAAQRDRAASVGGGGK